MPTRTHTEPNHDTARYRGHARRRGAAPLLGRLAPLLAALFAVAILAPLTAPAARAAQPGVPGLDPFDTLDFKGANDEEDRPEVIVSAIADRAGVAPGSTAVVAVIFDMLPGWHVNLNEPVIPESWGDFPAIPTEIRLAENELARRGPIQWPEPYAATVALGGEPTEYLVYDGRAIAYLPIEVAEDAQPGQTLGLTLTVSYQACDDTLCLAPESLDLTVELDLVELSDAPGPDAANAADFAAFDPAVFSDPDAWDRADRADAGGAALGGSKFFGLTIPRADSAGGIVVVALLAIAGGFILNLTPCVLPVIPIKIMTLSQHAGSPGKSFSLGLWMAGGVIAFWLALGVLAATFTELADPSRLFGYWWFTGAIGVLIAVMGVGIMGAFNINLPQKVYMINPKADSPGGSFMFGVMTAVLGLPCFGFVAGALLAGSATMPAAVILTIFGAMGFGMALPYLVLSAKPEWVDRLPRTGPASELVKQVMGLLLLAAAAYFIGAGVRAIVTADPALDASLPWWTKVIHWWVVAGFAAGAGVWLLVRTVQITKKLLPRGAFAVVALILGAGGVGAGVQQSLAAHNNIWTPYEPESLQALIDDDQVIVLDFTAEWCLNCKALESSVLLVDPVKSQLTSTEVVAIKADLTSTAAPGWDLLRDLGQTGIPLLAVYGPGLDTPWLSNAYTTDQVLEAIDAARGTQTTAAAD